MKLSLNHEDLHILISQFTNLESVRYTTNYESKLSGLIIREFLQSLIQKFMKQKETYSVSIDEKTLIVLNNILPQINTSAMDHFSQMRIREIYQEINIACLSI